MALTKVRTGGLTDDAVTTDKLYTPNLGRRNLIINGAYQVWQRGSSATTAVDNLFLADRFKLFEGTDGSFTTERSTDTPEGFGYSNKLQVTTADTSLASGQYVQYAYYIESQDLQQLAYGTSAAKYVTLSFWVKSSKTGSYGFTFKKAAVTQYQYPTMFTIDSANTWEKKVIVIPPLTTGGLLLNNNTIGMFLSWNLAFGSSYTNATANQWTTTGANYSTSEQVNWMDSTSNNFYITGVQLEAGSAATPFEHRSYAEELALCQRYFQIVSGTADNQHYLTGALSRYSTNTGMISVQLHKVMRAEPSMSVLSKNGSAASDPVGNVQGNNNNDDFNSGNMTLQQAHDGMATISVGLDFNPSASYAHTFYFGNGERLDFDAEL
jgi:hypothetical protein